MAALQSVSEVIENDGAGNYSNWEDFDDALWSALCSLIDFNAPQAILRFPEAVWVYFATRLIEGEVGNGGFAQAVMNFPGWLEIAARGNEVLGKPQLAGMIRSADDLTRNELNRIAAEHKIGGQDAFEYFGDDIFATLDEQLEEIGWECGEERVRYVRTHRDQFASL